MGLSLPFTVVKHAEKLGPELEASGKVDGRSPHSVAAALTVHVAQCLGVLSCSLDRVAEAASICASTLRTNLCIVRGVLPASLPASPTSTQRSTKAVGGGGQDRDDALKALQRELDCGAVSRKEFDHRRLVILSWVGGKAPSADAVRVSARQWTPSKKPAPPAKKSVHAKTTATEKLQSVLQPVMDLVVVEDDSVSYSAAVRAQQLRPTANHSAVPQVNVVVVKNFSVANDFSSHITSQVNTREIILDINDL